MLVHFFDFAQCCMRVSIASNPSAALAGECQGLVVVVMGAEAGPLPVPINQADAPFAVNILHHKE